MTTGENNYDGLLFCWGLFTSSSETLSDTYYVPSEPTRLGAANSHQSVDTHTSLSSPSPTTPLPIIDSRLIHSHMIAAKSSKSSKPRFTKQARSTRRIGPLNAVTRMKADEMRSVGACWRCKKYKKPVSKP
jgi:hypothetical protein